MPTDPINVGLQFHGEIQGGTNGFGPSASIGVGFNRVAILFAPSFLISSLGSAANSISISVAVRIYFRSRQKDAIVAFIRPEALLGAVLSGSNAFGALGFGGGVEYLLTRNLGFTGELGIRLSSGGFALSTTGAFGIMLHT